MAFEEELGRLQVPIVVPLDFYQRQLLQAERMSQASGLRHGQEMARGVERSFQNSFAPVVARFQTSIAGALAGSFGVHQILRNVNRELEEGRLRAIGFSREMTELLSLGNNIRNAASVKGAVLTKSSGLGFETREIADAQFAIESAAANLSKEIQRGILAESIELSQVTGALLPDSVRVLTKTFQIYRDELEDVNDAQNQLLLAAELGDTTFQQLAGKFPQIASAAQSAGFAIEQALGSLSTATRLGGNFERDSVAVRNIFLIVKEQMQKGLIAPTDDLGEALARIEALGPSVFDEVFGKENVTTAQNLANATSAMRKDIEAIAGAGGDITGEKLLKRLQIDPTFAFAEIQKQIEQIRKNEGAEFEGSDFVSGRQLRAIGLRGRLDFGAKWLGSLESLLPVGPSARSASLEGMRALLENRAQAGQGREVVMEFARALATQVPARTLEQRIEGGTLRTRLETPEELARRVVDEIFERIEKTATAETVGPAGTGEDAAKGLGESLAAAREAASGFTFRVDDSKERLRELGLLWTEVEDPLASATENLRLFGQELARDLNPNLKSFTEEITQSREAIAEENRQRGELNRARRETEQALIEKEQELRGSPSGMNVYRAQESLQPGESLEGYLGRMKGLGGGAGWKRGPDGRMVRTDEFASAEAAFDRFLGRKQDVFGPAYLYEPTGGLGPIESGARRSNAFPDVPLQPAYAFNPPSPLDPNPEPRVRSFGPSAAPPDLGTFLKYMDAMGFQRNPAFSGGGGGTTINVQGGNYTGQADFLQQVSQARAARPGIL